MAPEVQNVVDRGSVVVIDNYDSFTYNLSQVKGPPFATFFHQSSLCSTWESLDVITQSSTTTPKQLQTSRK